MASTDNVQAAVDTVKVGSVWAAVGISSWGDVASALAAIYTVILMGEWIWKKLARPYLENKGVIARKSRRKYD